jgi:hypothetical protein
MIDRAVILLLAGSAFFGSVVFVELSSDASDVVANPPASARPEPGAPPRVQGRRIDDLLATVLSRPLFSPTRQPAAHENPDQSTGLGLTDVRLSGIVIEPGHRLAIFAIPGAKPAVRGEGETVNDWRVDRITLREVVLSGPTGSTTMEPKIDTSLVQRAPAPPRPAPGQPQAAAAAAPPAAAPGTAPGARPRAPGLSAPASPGTAPQKPASTPAAARPGTPMSPLRPPGNPKERQ